MAVRFLMLLIQQLHNKAEQFARISEPFIYMIPNSHGIIKIYAHYMQQACRKEKCIQSLSWEIWREDD
jgi:hypothetical protein